MYGSPARMRVEREAARRSSGSVVISTLLSLLVVAAAVGVVAYLVLRTPSSPVDSAERLDPIGTALPAPTDQPTLPTPLPATEPEPTALGFTGDAPEASVLPTVAAPAAVAAPQQAGPTPTPRLVAIPTVAALAEIPPTVPPPPPTLPPAVPVEDVPVVALAPVESAPPAAPTAEIIQQAPPDREPTPAAEALDDDPFNIFDDDDDLGIVPVQNDALERAREIQEAADPGDDDNQEGSDPVTVPEIVPAEDDSPVVTAPDGSIEIVMPDVDAMIDEIATRATNPDRNRNDDEAGRPDNGQNRDEDNRDDNGRDRNGNNTNRETPPAENRRKSARERINERLGRNPSRPTNQSGRNANNPVVPVVPNNSGNQDQGECRNPFANIPEDRRPEGFPFDNC